MKKLVLGLLATVLSFAGLVGVSSSPATAACPYTNCIVTATNSAGPAAIRPGARASYKVGVRAVGNTAPRGTVTMRAYRKGRPGVIAQATKRVVPAGGGISRTSFKTPKLNRGTYTIVFRYTPAAGSVFKGSVTRRSLTVRPRRG
jgi:hypothetical protein